MFEGSALFSNKNYNKRSLKWKNIVDSEYEKNEWIKVSLEWIKLLKDELDELNVERNIPVLITSQYLIHPLINYKYCKNYIKALSNLKSRNTKYKEEVIKIINK